MLRVIKFIFVSGLGFFIDFILYSILIRIINADIFIISLYTLLKIKDEFYKKFS